MKSHEKGQRYKLVKHSLRNSIFACILLVPFEKILRAHSCCWCDKADDYIVLLNQDMFAREYVHLRSTIQCVGLTAIKWCKKLGYMC